VATSPVINWLDDWNTVPNVTLGFNTSDQRVVFSAANFPDRRRPTGTMPAPFMRR
jgi:hypothetical protein